MDKEARPSGDLEQRIELPVQFCPVCSTRLDSRYCKMVCSRCGFFMSCSEFE